MLTGSPESCCLGHLVWSLEAFWSVNVRWLLLFVAEERRRRWWARSHTNLVLIRQVEGRISIRRRYSWERENTHASLTIPDRSELMCTRRRCVERAVIWKSRSRTSSCFRDMSIRIESARRSSKERERETALMYLYDILTRQVPEWSKSVCSFWFQMNSRRNSREGPMVFRSIRRRKHLSFGYFWSSGSHREEQIEMEDSFLSDILEESIISSMLDQ